jgi:hypothetical protein
LRERELWAAFFGIVKLEKFVQVAVDQKSVTRFPQRDILPATEKITPGLGGIGKVNSFGIYLCNNQGFLFIKAVVLFFNFIRKIMHDTTRGKNYEEGYEDSEHNGCVSVSNLRI